MRLNRSGLIAVAVCLSSIPAGAREQRFSVPGHGSLLLSAPKEWRVETRLLQVPPSVSLRFRPPSGDAFSIQVTSVWLDPARRPDVTPDSMKKQVQTSAEASLPKAVEKKVAVVKLRGKHAIGYYFSLTDQGRSAGPRNYKYMTQGSFLTGPLLTVFTVLRRNPRGAEKEQALRAFANAFYSAQ